MNELARIETNVEAYRASTEAAALCKEIVVATSSQIQGRRYVSVEGWQAIARAHGCAAGARDVKRVDGGVSAIGEIRDIHTGSLIASAEGFVGEDEPTWFGGISKSGKTKGQTLPKRDDYAIRAMAQTRAMSRACRSAFAHVVVMMKANLATTPAEEVPQGGFDAETGEIIEREKVPGITKIKERLNAFMTEGNKATDLDAFRALVKDNRDDIKAIRDGNHEYWTGDGGDSEGFDAWMRRRYGELSITAVTAEPSENYSLAMETLETCTSSQELNAWFKLNWKYVEELDGAERDRVEARYRELETAFKAVDVVGAG